MRTAFVLVASMLLSLACSEGLAQGSVELNKRQLELRDEGIKELKKNKFDRAIRLFKQMNSINESNLSLANLGRAYQLKGDCKLAQRHYQKAYNAPRASNSTSHAEVTKKLDAFQEELLKECPGTLTVICKPANAVLKVDNRKESCDTEITLDPGFYRLSLEFEDKQQVKRIEIKAMKDLTHTLSIGAPADDGVVAEGTEDKDGDGIPDDKDNCPNLSSANQSDTDGDGQGDKCDDDDDNDGVPDKKDNCPRIPNKSQADKNNNGKGDACDKSRPVRPQRSEDTTMGWGFSLGGIALAIAAPILFTSGIEGLEKQIEDAEGEEKATLEEELEGQQVGRVVVTGMGAIFAAVGIYILVDIYSSDSGSAGMISPMVFPNGAGAVWSSPF